MVKTSVILVEEHDQVDHGCILVQKIDKGQELEVEDVYGNKHRIENYVVMTEDTMWALLDVLQQPELNRQLGKYLPAGVDKITVKSSS